ncbi:hypothetical protein E2562_028112 [Oryza meyeriana var. granulata]|uniref:Uncharacterized protein n=1 Tax=Oryza meyeriana var. granulata TaxID=110450 RepID=A0A6G1C819_9ORYZ|nr:hypothetical protein E2562_028112 [Oryza meyeriana var. granulata]
MDEMGMDAGKAQVHLDYMMFSMGCDMPECYRQSRREGYNYGQNGPDLDCCCFGRDDASPEPSAHP